MNDAIGGDDDGSFAVHPYLLQAIETPPVTVAGDAKVRPLHPPPGFMLHSWKPLPDGNVAVLWVRYKSDPGTELAAKLYALTRPKSEGE